ncbi:MAG: large subunit ribosomal protein L31 [bacterium]|jgi:large subunit ribosomal protein L31
MKAEIHPSYEETAYSCTCGNSFKVRSTLGAEFKTEVCAKCHPYYTGEENFSDTTGRIERFKKKYQK